ncbi:glycosyl transferase, family 2 (plasmid) [Deinococcus geothermalis DSM 11300]|uniref:Glycosyl transferase, family 2 n=1 Tax=Deinococcus geothermalis (strain DSM 11300 / CIP 105573 / AG-3a) TaxID=319795 RepID=Q1J349_DEIGD|nr:MULTISPECIES: glycosyltransferase family 2 protein [Deinococcus]ABF44085.1 glycosyl transferase, family 2 [Deinococcus geothermalis DSM 11300]TDE86168.1 glycosyltransferase family 2 protein [Deinococcus sp. S9]
MGQEQREKGVEAPLVSVVIPTHRRADLLLRRALPSALGQTLQELEVIVVVDGADPETLVGLATVRDARVRVVALRENVGGAEARNVGIRQARAEWVALLDDDDEWLPHKLERQLRLAQASSWPWPIVACGWIARHGGTDSPQPVRFPDPGEALGDYLLASKSYYVRDCSFMSTLILTRRELLLRVPFTPGLPKHQDTDWLLRAGQGSGVGVEFLPEIAAIWYFEEGREQMSRTRDWRWSLDWARAHWRANRMSNHAYAGFIVTHLAPYVRRQREWQAVWPLFRELLVARPRAFEVLRYLRVLALPLGLRQTLRQVLDQVFGPVRLPVRLTVDQGQPFPTGSQEALSPALIGEGQRPTPHPASADKNSNARGG